MCVVSRQGFFYSLNEKTQPRRELIDIDTAINRLLRANTWALERLRAHAGKSAVLSCPPLEARVTVLASGELEWVQLLIHPEIWAYPGDRMGETMRAMLDAERERRLADQAPARDHHTLWA